MKRNTTLLFSTLLALAAFLVVGCKTVDVETLITPKRIEAVTALGAYYGGKAAIAKGHQAELNAPWRACGPSRPAAKPTSRRS